jgi:tripartite-type tricarboxylate transporter receptor subunit TctC
MVEAASRRALLSAAAALVAPGIARAQTAWPDRPIRFIVPFAPGGNVDRIARVLAASWSTRLGQPFVAENRGGAGGTLGATLLEQSRPDGYTLMAGSDGAVLLDPRAPDTYADPLRRFVPIGLMSRSTSAVMVPSNSPWQTVGDLVAAARARPGQIGAGHPGIGTSGQRAIQRLSRIAHIELTEVAYRGGGDALADVVAGNIPSLFTELSTVLPMAQSGHGRILAVAAARRSAVAPDVPTFTESGFGFEEGAFVGLVGPMGLAPNVVAILAQMLAASVAAPGLAAELARMAIEPPTAMQATPDGFRDFLTAKLRELRGEAGTR